MRFKLKSKIPPKHNDCRHVKKFAFIPTSIEAANMYVWLEYYWEEQIYMAGSHDWEYVGRRLHHK